MIFAVYKTDSGEIVRSLDMPEFLKSSVTLKKNEAIVEIPRMAHDATEYIKDGKLTTKPDTSTAS